MSVSDSSGPDGAAPQNKLLILAADADVYAGLIAAEKLQNLEVFTDSGTTVVSTGIIADCNIILGEPSLVKSVLSSASGLQWVQSSWAGVDSLCQPGLRRDFVLTGVKDVFGPMINEYVTAYIFALERGLFEMRSAQRQKNWHPLPYRQAADIAVGIVGLGSIGQFLAANLGKFGIRVTGLNRSGAACAAVEKVYTLENLADFLADPDYVVVTLPDTHQTRHFINAESLAMMKPSAVLINVGRGSVVSEQDLVDALQRGVIAGAVLDVFEQEPLPQSSPLWDTPNTDITPHIAADSFPENIVRIFAENYRRFIQRQPLMHVIDLELGY